MDREGLAYLQDLFFILVATAAVSMLLVNLSSIYLARQEIADQKELNTEADRLCEAVLTYVNVVHDRQRGLLDHMALDNLSVENLVSDLRISIGFSIAIATDVGSSAPRDGWAWSSGFPPSNRGACVTSCVVWFDDGDVRPARITLWTWRA